MEHRTEPGLGPGLAPGLASGLGIGLGPSWTVQLGPTDSRTV